LKKNKMKRARPRILANLKIIRRFHAHPVHQNSVDICGPRYVRDDTSWILFEKYLPSRYIMEGYPNLRFKLQMNEYPCIDCGSNVRLRQEALQCDQCSQWQHRLCNTSKTFLSNFIAFVYYLTPQIINRKSRNVVSWKHWQFPQLLTRTHIA
jgi:hypothetical protein